MALFISHLSALFPTIAEVTRGFGVFLGHFVPLKKLIISDFSAVNNIANSKNKYGGKLLNIKMYKTNLNQIYK